jgi:hypothetical protein
MLHAKLVTVTNKFQQGSRHCPHHRVPTVIAIIMT